MANPIRTTINHTLILITIMCMTTAILSSTTGMVMSSKLRADTIMYLAVAYDLGL